jgi:hypothetical protein
MEKALKDAKAAVQNNEPRLDFDNDEELDAALRRELIEIACSTAVSDPERLLDLVLARLSGGRWVAIPEAEISQRPYV